MKDENYDKLYKEVLTERKELPKQFGAIEKKKA